MICYCDNQNFVRPPKIMSPRCILRRVRCLCLSGGVTLALVSPLYGRQIQPSPSAFHIAIIDGEGALNNIEGRLAREPIVQVEDKNHKRVPGAYVEFDSPNQPGAPGAQFESGGNTLTSMTDAAGQAVAHGIRNNGVPGKFDIRVTVKYQGQTVGTTVIHQINICGKVANVARAGLTHNPAGNQEIQPFAPGVPAVAVGEQMLVNGSSVPSNANLTNGASLESLGSPVRIFLGKQCQFLMAPHSAGSIQNGILVLEKGAVRSEPFGSCSVSSHGLQVQGEQETAEGAIRVAGGRMEVGSIAGSVRVLDAKGVVKDVVNPCTASAFLLLTGATAASASGFLYAALAASLAGLGFAIDAGAQKSTSP
jgi:hypothetical protein